ncbi:hypothetical protein KQX54_021720 [Cotesia glomerata]|uniref:Uncharacterized protein n=1 Tax=Cotesia glomerata TaxID=32391 RepID=A0AAV7IVZ3_COTGL|nr:hypothetical protein KQX54_021720 [Cotesia glomerata]
MMTLEIHKIETQVLFMIDGTFGLTSTGGQRLGQKQAWPCFFKNPEDTTHTRRLYIAYTWFSVTSYEFESLNFYLGARLLKICSRERYVSMEVF